MTMTRSLAAIALAGSLLASPARAQSTPGFSFTSVSTVTGSWTLGYQFNVLSSVYVTSLGFFDFGQDGFVDSHEIGLWDPFGALLGSATIAAGGGTLDGWFRYASVDPFLLSVGEGYRIAATSGTDRFGYRPTNLTSDPAVKYVAGVYALSPSLVYPDVLDVSSTSGYFGPNMMLAYELPPPAGGEEGGSTGGGGGTEGGVDGGGSTGGGSTGDVGPLAPTVTPEPATMALLATGLVGMMGAGWARRRRSTV